MPPDERRRWPGLHETVFYCVANMPGAVPHTSTHALTSVTLPYVVRLADQGWREALRGDDALARGRSTHGGEPTNAEVAHAHDLPFRRLEDVVRG